MFDYVIITREGVSVQEHKIIAIACARRAFYMYVFGSNNKATQQIKGIQRDDESPLMTHTILTHSLTHHRN